MACGVRVNAKPARSGPTAFLTDQNAFLLPPAGLEPAFEREPLLRNNGPQREHQWAAVDPAALRILLRHVFTHRRLAREAGLAARRTVLAAHTREAVAALMFARLREIQAMLAARHNAAVVASSAAAAPHPAEDPVAAAAGLR